MDDKKSCCSQLVALSLCCTGVEATNKIYSKVLDIPFVEMEGLDIGRKEEEVIVISSEDEEEDEVEVEVGVRTAPQAKGEVEAGKLYKAVQVHGHSVDADRVPGLGLGKAVKKTEALDLVSLSIVPMTQSLDRIKQVKDGNLWYGKPCWRRSVCAQLMQAIIKETKPSEANIKLYGKSHKLKRLQAAFSDGGLSYEFSGTKVAGRAWTPMLKRVKEYVETRTGEQFNFCLVNLYRHGQDYISYHRDDERNLVARSSIAGVTLGVTREMHFQAV